VTAKTKKADPAPTEEAVTEEPTETPEAAESVAPEESAAETTTPRRPRPRVSFRLSRRLVVAAFALLLATTTATAVIQWRTAHRLAARDRTEEEVRDRSADFGRALLAYKYTNLSAARARIGALTSSDFSSSYETAFDGLASVITKYQATATATVRDIYLNDFDGQRAKTLVVLDSEVKSTMGVRRVLGTKLLLQLVLEKGSWRVDSMTTFAADDESLTKPDGRVERPQQGTPTAQPTP
jgi:hypothetical protein